MKPLNLCANAKRVTTLALTFALALAISVPNAQAGHHEDGNHKKDKSEHHMKADKNGDGILSYDEFISMKKERFEQMDADNDGNLTKEEMRNAHQKYRKKFKKTGQKLCDKDKAKDKDEHNSDK